MKIVLDTQVLFSGLLFWGPANQILQGWRNGRLKIVLSPEILEEYQKVGKELESSHAPLRISPFLELLVAHAQMIHSPSILPPIREDHGTISFWPARLSGKAELCCERRSDTC